MSSSNEHSELQKRRDGLESTMMSMAAHGLGIPDDLAEELAKVQSRLSELGAPVEIKPWTSWLGSKIEGFSLLERLSSGNNSHVFRAKNQESGEQCAIKLASTNAVVSGGTHFAKQMIRTTEEGPESIEFSPNKALELECQRLQSDTSGVFVKVLSSGYTSENNFYFRMPLLVGQSLQDLLALEDSVLLASGLEILGKLASVLQEFSDSGNKYHGNLQPDNIFISKTDLVLLSPGCFNFGEANDTQFTTSAYYPNLLPDDALALGFVLWQLICKQHPLAPSERQERPQIFSEATRQTLLQAKAQNAAALSELLKFVAPRDLRHDLNNDAETLLMKAINIKTDQQGYLTISDGFNSAREFSEALKAAANKGLLRRF